MLKKIAKKANDAVTRVKFGKPPEGPGPASLEEAELVGLHGDPLPTDAYQGKVVLFVNVASRCGLTPQYETLVKIRERFHEQGFEIVGAPCNQFLGQEPGTAEEIESFCAVTYGVDFPLLAKQEVNGGGRSPLYQFLINSEAGGGENISWNFEKFLVDREGEVRFRFAPSVQPDAPEVIAAIESLL
ncbi:glutathione peroxidase [Lujinxingia vulgaris]|uniref:Glutathione peroxidase n=1 Tax=Lujinxingia vulgaris TaxID=2600176 RepID=A0A5C6XRL2_9DELT|nr:glutathione peroxidase [Lujinxingia vulgaris]TXD41276.1 glutathione peroxidase [Lujinxingia vulgaris]